MGKIVQQFSDGSYLEYDSGTFDEWCVYLTRPGHGRYAPRDNQYFNRLKDYASRHNNKVIYDDFVIIYDKTTKILDESIFSDIIDMCSKYGNDSLDIAIDFCIMYMGMVAEENKEFTKLGKRIKRLGVYQVLMENFPPEKAANYSRGKNWKELSNECNKRGF